MPPPFRPGRRRGGQPLYGGQPLTLPQASTFPASVITASSAHLNGSVNPQGNATSWWFAWGTTPQYGSLTSATSAGSGSLPVAVTVTLTGLAIGTTYHFAAVAQSAAGTVFGTDQSFIAQAQPQVTSASSPLVPTGAPLVSIPHLAYPFTLTNSGANVVEQDSLDEVFACVQAVANCPVGACPELPTFGMPDMTFSQAPLDPTPLLQAVSRWEPRADERAVTQALDDAGDQWQATLTTRTIGTSESS